jgi:hypothetical protein
VAGTVLRISLFACCCIYVIIACDLLAIGNGRMCIVQAVYALVSCATAICIAYQFLPLDAFFILVGSVMLVCELVSEWYFKGTLAGAELALAPWFLFFPGICFVVIRCWNYYSAYLLVRNDKLVFDAIWDDVLLREGAALENLKLTTYEISRLCKSQPRQLYTELVSEGMDKVQLLEKSYALAQASVKVAPRGVAVLVHAADATPTVETPKMYGILRGSNFAKSSKMLAALPFSMSMSPGHKRMRNVTSLDQLFAQAAGMQMILRRKVQEWAMHAGGCFQVEGTGELEFVTWSDVCQRPDVVARIKWGKLKSVSRSVEKLLGAYQEDVSRLLDVCRERIVFNTVQDLLVCLENISRDRCVRIVRIKNRLDPAYNAHETAGYRYAFPSSC